MQIGFAAWLLGINAYGSRAAWYKFGGGSPKSPLYGIWNVDQLVADGQPRAALVTDGHRLRRLIFQSPQLAVIQRMDDRSTYCGAAVNLDKRTVALTKFSDPKWKANFTFERSAKDRLTLDGAMDGHHLHIQLQLLDHRKFELINRGFHWIQEYPYNR